MLKRIATIFIVLAYGLFSSGLVIDAHYCMGKLAAVDWTSPGSKSCAKCGMSKTGCCKDEVKVVKLDDSHQLSSANTFVALAPAAIPNPLNFLFKFDDRNAASRTAVAITIPHRSPVERLPLLGVFRI